MSLFVGCCLKEIFKSVFGCLSTTKELCHLLYPEALLINSKGDNNYFPFQKANENFNK